MQVQVIRSNRKTISLQVKDDYTVIIRCPKRTSKRDLEKILDSHKEWIYRQLDKVEKKDQLKSQTEPLTQEELDALYQKAKEIIPKRVAYYAPIVGVDYGRITIRCQKTRWGSCSSKGNLNFNCLLMLAPPEVVDAIVVHELCHRIEMNHSSRFYGHVRRVYPAYDKWIAWLKKNGEVLQWRVS